MNALGIKARRGKTACWLRSRKPDWQSRIAQKETGGPKGPSGFTQLKNSKVLLRLLLKQLSCLVLVIRDRAQNKLTVDWQRIHLDIVALAVLNLRHHRGAGRWQTPVGRVHS
ncbi:MAG: hypothetical protein AAFV74_19015, partial [Pseudomonadota bacterium]